MAFDTEHAQILEKLGDLHEKRMIDALAALEDKIAGLLGSAPLKDGKLFDLEWAIAARRDILKVMTEEYLNTANKNVTDYKKAAESATKMISRYTDFVGLSPETINSLQRVSFQGFEDIAGTFLNELSNEVYQNTLTGRPIDESIKAVRQKINGVYAQSDQAEVARLVNIANAGGAGADRGPADAGGAFPARSRAAGHPQPRGARAGPGHRRGPGKDARLCAGRRSGGPGRGAVRHAVQLRIAAAHRLCRVG